MHRVTKLFLPVLVLLFALLGASARGATELPNAFDPQRHMLVSEVAPGMKGYGLSVFSGTRIERFEVEVVSILRNFNPGQDVVLIRASGANLEHTGPIAGMSGSPIYLKDAQGKTRLIGAFAYGWPMMKDPLAGVQPIEYMLRMPADRQQMADASELPPAPGQWSVLQSLSSMRRPIGRGARPEASREIAETRVAPLAVPLSVAGLSDSALTQMQDLFAAYGLRALQAGGGSGSTAAIKLEPGSVMAVPLLTGDMDMTAVGTCTEVIDGKAYGFGHPFTGTGPVQMPMCAGQIQAVIANLVTSFKLGSAGKPLGALNWDETSGVAGKIGSVPEGAPVRWRIKYADGSLDREYRFTSVVHPQFTPLLATMAAFRASSASRQLPHFNTVEYRMTIDFSNGQSVRLADRIVNAEPMSLFAAISSPMAIAADNPFSRVLVKRVEGELIVHEGAASAELVHVGSARQVYRPGETLRLFARLQPFRGAETSRELDFALPADLPDGGYQLTVSSLDRFMAEEQTSDPYRFSATKIEHVFAVLNDLAQLRSDAIYMRLTRSTPGVYMGRNSLPQLPGSQRQMLLSSARSDIAEYKPSAVRNAPVDWVISGEAALEIQVSRSGKPLPSHK